MLAYYDAMMGLASRVLRAMALALGVEENYFRRQVRPPGERVPHDPLSGGEAAAAAGTVGAPAPTPTTGIMTFVRGDDTPGGLQVKHRNGGWIDVHIPPNEFVCTSVT